MKSRSVKGLSIFGGIVLIVGGLLANYGTGVPQAGAQAAPPNPLTVIIDKLNEILSAIGNISQGNHTLRWDQVLPAAQRFVVLAAFNNEAVLDKETGLVWEKSPATTTHDWRSAHFQCNGRTTGGRKGWRLPSVAEQASLVDPSVFQPGPTLPPGHPFLNVQSSYNHWSASTVAVDPTFAWYVSFYNGDVGHGFKLGAFYVWCVRGPMQESVY